ncbi:hypothetical protein CMUS01_16520 [Colletotrichum musicola]|uniref:Uncharacterized protein n=1 Tax=Colletotrichum musicola TaxID=2175873 RepID=A0A8H6IN59_9PEZI|nr:hypothetical protein CMUS01_16520 [Colletotrichum musicola]
MNTVQIRMRRNPINLFNPFPASEAPTGLVFPWAYASYAPDTPLGMGAPLQRSPAAWPMPQPPERNYAAPYHALST